MVHLMPAKIDILRKVADSLLGLGLSDIRIDKATSSITFNNSGRKIEELEEVFYSMNKNNPNIIITIFKHRTFHDRDRIWVDQPYSH